MNNSPNMKKLFYCLRTSLACLWVKKHKKMPPVLFTEMLTEDLLPKEVIEEIKTLIEDCKEANEDDQIVIKKAIQIALTKINLEKR